MHFNPVVLDRSTRWVGAVPLFARVSVRAPDLDLVRSLHGRGIEVEDGPGTQLKFHAEAWQALEADTPEVLQSLVAEVSQTLAEYRKAETGRFPLADGITAGPDHCLIMGILNVTPDSFSDGGRHATLDRALEHGLAMDREGADIIDIGGESTRPGADPVTAEEEMDRVLPVIEQLARQTRAALSIDTMKASVASAALDAGASVVNDVSGFRFDPEITAVAAEKASAAVVMHMQGEPRTMQKNPRYCDLFGEILSALRESVNLGMAAGLSKDRIVVDPGIGFGKTLEHNLSLIRHLHRFFSAGCPVLLGPSRKAFLGAILDLPSDERVEGTLAACAQGRSQGCHIVRVHDVREAVRCLKVTDALQRVQEG